MDEMFNMDEIVVIMSSPAPDHRRHHFSLTATFISQSSLDVHIRPNDDASIMLIHIGKVGGSAMPAVFMFHPWIRNDLTCHGYYMPVLATKITTTMSVAAAVVAAPAAPAK